MLYVYDLTPLTRKANHGRRVIIQGFDLPRRGILLLMSGIVVTLLPGMLFYMLLGANGIFVHLLLIGGWFWLIESRTRSGLRLRRYQALMDRQLGSQNNVFLRCWAPVEASTNAFCWLRASAVPASTTTTNTPEAPRG